MSAVLRAVARAAAAVPAAQLARLGFPVLIGAFGLAVLVLAAACWVLASGARCERAAKVTGSLPRRARRSSPCPGPGPGALVAAAAGRVAGEYVSVEYATLPVLKTDRAYGAGPSSPGTTPW